MSLYSAYVKPKDAPLQGRMEQVVDVIRPIDWSRVLLDLRNAGVTQKTISAVVDVAEGTISGWMTGSIPNYEAGRKLIAVHAEATGKIAPTIRQSVAGKAPAIAFPEAASL